MEIVNFINTMPAQEKKQRLRAWYIIIISCSVTCLTLALASAYITYHYVVQRKKNMRLMQIFNQINNALPAPKITTPEPFSNAALFDALNAIFTQIPNDITLITLERQSNTITLKGASRTHGAITQYVAALEKQPSILNCTIAALEQKGEKPLFIDHIYYFTLTIQEADSTKKQ